mgnify:CR=1 FL=1
MKIATWNVNSIKARVPRVLEWLEYFSPDIVLLQEVKSTSETFPYLELEDSGYNIAVSGQKTYNGVAILSKSPIEIQLLSLPGDETDEQARYIEAITGGVRVCSIYLPNGNPTLNDDGSDSDKFLYKISWMARLFSHMRQLLTFDEAIIFGGDYNVCPLDQDTYDPIAFQNDALCRIESRKKYRSFINLGLTNALRVFERGPNIFSYWDYQRGAWAKDNGLLIDHLLLSPFAADRLVAAGVDKSPRAKEKPSDHTPIEIELA